MKVGDDNNGPGAGDLFDRMEEAHRQERTDPVGSAEGAAAADKVVEVASGQSIEGDTSSDELEAKLLELVSSALDGDYASEAALRDAVLDAIIEQRYAARLTSDDAEQVRHTIKTTLGQDPVFRKEVDNMLVQAARRLGQHQSG